MKQTTPAAEALAQHAMFEALGLEDGESARYYIPLNGRYRTPLADLDPKLGFEIGWDHALHGMAPPADAPKPVLDGYKSAQEHGQRRKATTRYERKWVRLRYSAWLRARVVAAAVTPAFLQRLDSGRCPVTRQALTYDQPGDTHFSYDRLNNDGAYAPGNLAVMSVRANEAKGAHSFDEVVAFSRKSEPTKGLAPAEWARLAALMAWPCLALTNLFARVPAASLPSRCVPVLPHARLQLLVLRDLYGGEGRLLGRIRRACQDARAEQALHKLVCKLRRKERRGAADLYLMWADPTVFRLFEAWLDALGPQGEARMAELTAAALRDSSDRMGILIAETWSLETAGYLPASERGRAALAKSSAG